MRIVDLNVLVYATDTASEHHMTAAPWLDRAMESTQTIGLPTAVTVGLRSARDQPEGDTVPSTAGDALAIVASWLGRANVAVPQPSARHYAVMGDLLAATGTGSNLARCPPGGAGNQHEADDVAVIGLRRGSPNRWPVSA